MRWPRRVLAHETDRLTAMDAAGVTGGSAADFDLVTNYSLILIQRKTFPLLERRCCRQVFSDHSAEYIATCKCRVHVV